MPAMLEYSQPVGFCGFAASSVPQLLRSQVLVKKLPRREEHQPTCSRKRNISVANHLPAASTKKEVIEQSHRADCALPRHELEVRGEKSSRSGWACWINVHLKAQLSLATIVPSASCPKHQIATFAIPKFGKCIETPVGCPKNCLNFEIPDEGD